MTSPGTLRRCQVCRVRWGECPGKMEGGGWLSGAGHRLLEGAVASLLFSLGGRGRGASTEHEGRVGTLRAGGGLSGEGPGPSPGAPRPESCRGKENSLDRIRRGLRRKAFQGRHPDF